MKVTMLLADAAQAVGGKLYILGGGWSLTGPAPAPSAIALKIEVPWDLGSRRHSFAVELLNADGQPVRVPTPAPASGGQKPVEEKPVRIEGTFETGIPAGLISGTPLDVTLALNIGPLRLPPGTRYTWKLTINGESREDWQAAFSTRAEQPGQPGRPR